MSFKLTNKKVCFAPHNELTISLAKAIFGDDISDIHFLDRNISSPNTYSVGHYDFSTVDLVIIWSPNYWLEISEHLPEEKSVVVMKSEVKHAFLSESNMLDAISAPMLKSCYQQLKPLKNKHLNKRSFIIGTGPSLTIKDLELLENEITFGCNKLYLAFDNTDWRPTYFTMSDPIHLKNSYDNVVDLKTTTMFFSFTGAQHAIITERFSLL